MSFTNSILLLLSALTLVLATPTVYTPQGITYEGVTSSNVDSFLNIRFGIAQRFAHAKPYTPPAHSNINATAPGAACPQRFDPLPEFPMFTNVTNMSEDCLNLRVDRPAGTSADAKLPVMVWIYGGGGSIGQIYDQSYIPTGLLLNAVANRAPVIYAAVNYRVNMFGYAQSRAVQEEGSLNAGLFDQRLGLEWVKENIVHFGGDPDNITIFGESEGGTDVALQLTAYGGEGKVPFNKAIMQSGATTSNLGLTSNTTAQNYAAVAAAVNCTHGDPDSVETLTCLRRLPMKQLIDAVVAVELEYSSLGLGAFIQTIDGTFIPDVPSELVRTGRFHKSISAIIGWNADDASLFTDSPATINSTSGVISFLHSSIPGLTNDTIAKILALYPESEFIAPVPYMRAARILRDAQFTCPSIELSHALSCGGGADTYMYMLNQSLFTPLFESTGASYYGVSHFSDIPYVFGLVSVYVGNNTGSEYAVSNAMLSRRMSGSWTQFSGTGVPGGDGKGVLEGWPMAWEGETEGQVRVIGGPGDGVVTIGVDEDWERLWERCEFWSSPEVTEELQT